jgi:four helix bundle protein
MTLQEWQKSVPEAIRGDTAWKMQAYRLGLFLSDIAMIDAKKLWRSRYTLEHADQIVRASSKISASIVEGYSRGTGKDRARFYEYALGSARETRDWYFKCRGTLGPAVTEHRLEVTTTLIKLLLTSVASERRANRRPVID